MLRGDLTLADQKDTLAERGVEERNCIGKASTGINCIQVFHSFSGKARGELRTFLT